MTLAAQIDDVQFVVDRQGKITSVLIALELWRQIVDVMENADDCSLIQSLRERLALAPEIAGSLRWDDVADQWE